MAHFAIIDLSDLFARARFGAGGADPETKVGMAVLILFRSLRKIHREAKVEHFVFAVDHGSWRASVYPAYKSRRKLARLSATQAEKDENELFNRVRNDVASYLSQHTRCTVLDAPGIEADDFVARWIARHPGDTHIIIAGDSDFVQLLAPNVRIYDAINGRMIATDKIIDDRGRAVGFCVNKKDGKIKIGGKPEEPEPEWWRKALFVKLIRGDAGDSVFPAYPGVRYESKRCSIRAAWEDRVEQGYDWNNLMFQTWDKLIDSSESGEPVTQTVRVIDEFRTNQMLIDLSKQPSDIVERMDQSINRAVTHQPNATQVGMGFLRLCKAHDQPNLLKEAEDHVRYLNAGYPKESSLHVD